MDCEKAQQQLPDWLSNQLSDTERQALEQHVRQCPACEAEWTADRQLWQLMGRLPVPEPSEAAQVRFQAMLDTYKETVEAPQSQPLNGFWLKLQSLLSPSSPWQLAYVILLIGLGAAAGYWFRPPSIAEKQYQQQVGVLSVQVQEMRQMLMLSLLEDPSASQRLRAVSYTNEMGRVNNRVVEALLTTLNNDPNVNVRLVTLEALVKLAGEPSVREGLVLSLTRQESPLVQVALAEVMVKLQEKRSVKPLKKLLQQEHLDKLVKSKIQQTIKDLS